MSSVAAVLNEGITPSPSSVLTTLLSKMNMHRAAGGAAHVNAVSPAWIKTPLQSLNSSNRRYLLLILKWVRESSQGSPSCMKMEQQMISSGGTAVLKEELVITIARVEEES